MKFLTRLLIAVTFTISFCEIKAQTVINLSGNWGFQFDITNFERSFENSGAHRDRLTDHITMPGTTDSNKKGILTTSRPINRLSRIYEYSGVAWYQKEVDIPKDWNGKAIELFFERILWISSVYLDGKLVGSDKSFSTPHTYTLTNLLTPGKHLLSVCIDNRIPEAFDKWSHAFSEYTQTAWNGIVGNIELRAFDIVNIKEIQVYPNVEKQTVEVVCLISNPKRESIAGSILINCKSSNSGKTAFVKPFIFQFSGSDKLIEATAIVPMGKNVLLWDEFSPALYQLTGSLIVTLAGETYKDTKEVTFGMRNYSQNGHHFTINGGPVFLRGTLECAIFPLTGYPDMTVEGWLRICNIVKSYGLNHIRFHSWCPPEAAFVAADQTGVYLQVELPAWTEMGKDTMLNNFFNHEMDEVLATYGNHPSFVQLCVGNELRGNFDFMASLIARAEKMDPRHLYSGSTARKHLPEDQFYVSHVSSAGEMTTYGARGPQTDYDLRKAYEVLKVPGVAHEVGQRAVYPNFEEMIKYTGVLYPRNFELFKDSLSAHGMLDQASDFFKTSGQMTGFLYKESIEALLRTPNCGGFQLLDLHDFPGQGTALVGILDPFWDSKGIITPEKFREFCSPTVPILRMTKRIFFNTEAFSATAELYHYGNKSLKNLQAIWDIKTLDNKTIASGKFEKTNVPIGALASLGQISATFAKIIAPQKLIVTISAGEVAKNSWEIWVYPKNNPEVKPDNFLISKTLDESAVTALNNGKSVLLLPDINQLEGKQADFQNHFWCPIMFRWEPMTMGALVKEKHPLYKYFPTEFYTNWQWWDIISNSKTLVLEKTSKEFRPILQVIDTYDRCLKEGTIFETRVGKGKLLMAAIDFEKDIENRPASQQLLISIKKYMESPDFNPPTELTIEYLKSKFKKPTLMTGSDEISLIP